ncbi:MAG: LytTR family transcriptional regulator DNA-binding domain-containing protein [Spirosomataceae bacterium]
MKTKFRKPNRKHESLLKHANDEIIRLEGNLNYTCFVFKTGRKEMMAYTIGVYNKVLPDNFLRVSKSFIINTKYVKDIDQTDKKITMTDKMVLQVSRRRWDSFCLKNSEIQ